MSDARRSNSILGRGLGFLRTLGGGESDSGEDGFASDGPAMLRSKSDGSGSSTGSNRAAARRTSGATPPRPGSRGAALTREDSAQLERLEDIPRDDLVKLCLKLASRLKHLEGRTKAATRVSRLAQHGQATMEALLAELAGLEDRSEYLTADGEVDFDVLSGLCRNALKARQSQAVDAAAKQEAEVQELRAQLRRERAAAQQLAGELRDQLAVANAQARKAAQQEAGAGGSGSSGGRVATRSAAGGRAAGGGSAGGGSADGGSAGTGAAAVEARDGGSGGLSGDGDDAGDDTAEELRVKLSLQAKWAREREQSWEAELETSRREVLRLTKANKSITADRDAEAARAARLTRQVNDLTVQIDRLSSANASLDAEAVKARDSANDAGVELEMELKSAQRVVADLRSRIFELEPALEKAQAQAAEASELRLQLHAVRQQLDASELLNAEKKMVMAELRTAATSATAAQETKEQELVDMGKELVDAQAQLAAAKEELAAATNELEALKRAPRESSSSAQPTPPSPSAGAADDTSVDSSHGTGRHGADEPDEGGVAELRAELDELRAERDELLERLERAEETIESFRHDGDVERLRHDATAKSRRALQLVQEKDATIAKLNDRVAELEAEIRTGRPEERMFLEIAKAQAQKEREVGAREARIRILEEELQASRNTCTAQEAKVERMQSEIEALHRSLSAAGPGVNMEYLKNVVLRYMTFGSTATESKSLVPVIATLLQFSEAEVQRIVKPKSWSEWWAGNTKYVAPPASPAPGSAASARTGSAAGASPPQRTRAAPDGAWGGAGARAAPVGAAAQSPRATGAAAAPSAPPPAYEQVARAASPPAAGRARGAGGAGREGAAEASGAASPAAAVAAGGTGGSGATGGD